MGTSLSVYPFASLAQRVDDSCPRVLINLDHVGDIGSRPDDVVLLGKCDDVVKDLCKELGWEDELTRLWNETEESVVSEQKDASGAAPTETEISEPSTSNPEEVKKPDALKEIEKQFAQLELDADATALTRTPDSTTDGDKEKATPAEPTAKEKSTSEATQAENASSPSLISSPPSDAKEATSTLTDNKL